MFGNVYGLDLGSYEIKVYDKKNDVMWQEKNVIAIADEKNIFSVGDDAYEMYEKTPENIEIVFPMVKGVISHFYHMQYLLQNLLKKERRFVGCELEFPLISLTGEPLDTGIITPFLEYLLTNGFSVEDTDIHGRGIFLINADGDCLSFDNSYNNFEFAMEKGENLIFIAERFYRLFALVQNFLLSHGHTLCGLGTNPRFSVSDTLPVEYPIYRTIRGFLSGFSGNGYHNIPYFPAWLSSVQTHLDVPQNMLPRALTVMAGTLRTCGMKAAVRARALRS